MFTPEAATSSDILCACPFTQGNCIFIREKSGCFDK